MSRRRRIFQHGEITIVLARFAGILSQTLDAEIRKAKTLNLGYVNSSVAVNQVGRRTVSLIARDGTVLVCPGSPLAREVFEEQVAKRFAIVAQNLRFIGQ